MKHKIPYDQRLQAAEENLRYVEGLYNEGQAALASVLRDRPCDFYLEYKGRVWVQTETLSGNRGGFSWATVEPEKAYTYKQRVAAERHARYLENLENKTGIQVKERAR